MARKKKDGPTYAPHVGNRFPVDPSKGYRIVHNKPWRRLIRHELMTGFMHPRREGKLVGIRIDAQLTQMRKERLEVDQLAENSHERARFREAWLADRAQKRQDQRAAMRRAQAKAAHAHR